MAGAKHQRYVVLGTPEAKEAKERPRALVRHEILLQPLHALSSEV